MIVYELRNAPELYRRLRPSILEGWVELVRQFNGTPLGDGWSPVEVEVYPEDLPGNRVMPDCPYLSGLPVFGTNAVMLLRDILESHGELLPLIFEAGDYYAYNVTTVIDALDLDNSDVEFFPNTNRIMDAYKYAFTKERLAGVLIFKIPQLAVSDVFVTDAFVQRVQDCGLTGFLFRPVWSDE